MKKSLPDNYLAALDIGTNSFHLIIAKAENNNIKIIDREREVIRLGSSEGSGLSFISENEIKEAIRILKDFKNTAGHYKAEIKAAATSAVREAKNKDEFINIVFKETGIKIEVLDGFEEAKLIYLGAEKALNLKGEKVLCVDIGGGSTEFILSDKGNIIFAESIKIGAVRLTKKFFLDFIITDERIRNCNDFIEKEIISNKNINLNENFDFAVGSSGTIEAAAVMINFQKEDKPINGLNGYAFEYEDLEKLTDDILGRITVRERLRIKGMEKKRADIIPAGLLILNKVFELFKLKTMKISEYALREGMIFDMMKTRRYFN